MTQIITEHFLGCLVAWACKWYSMNIGSATMDLKFEVAEKG